LSVDKEGTNDVGKKSQTETLPLIEDKVTSMHQMETLKETKDASTLATNQKLLVKVKKERSARNSKDKVTSVHQMETLKETNDDNKLATNPKLVVKVKKERSSRNSKDEEKPQPVIKRLTRKATEETVDENMQGTSKDAGKAANSADSQPVNKRQTRKDKVNKDNIKQEESATVKKLDKGNTVARTVAIHTDSSNTEGYLKSTILYSRLL